jgi:predicted aldo/keto reductase-like oxidoreductase
MWISRNTFLAAAAAAAASAVRPRAASAAAPLPQRPLGRTGAVVSIVTMGGYHIGQPKLSVDESVALIHAGIDRGINFLDNSWDYNNGESERRMGIALAQGGYRERVLLMTKVDGRTKQSAQQQLDESLARLKTDRIDLWQFHENIRPDDADRIFAHGGAIEAALEARKAGKIRFIGFTGHKSPDYHLHMFAVADAHDFHFDTVQMPVNVMDAHYRSFATNVIPVAQAHGTAVLAMKTFGDHFILDTGLVAPIDMLHYSMSQPVATVVTGIDSPQILDQAITAAMTFAPLTQAQTAAILAKTADAASSGSTELYKTTTQFDSTTKNPQYLG